MADRRKNTKAWRLSPGGSASKVDPDQFTEELDMTSVTMGDIWGAWQMDNRIYIC